MSIIIVSSEVMASEKQTAQAVAEAVGYELLGPEILDDIAAHNDLAADKLAASLSCSPSPWRRRCNIRDGFMPSIPMRGGCAILRAVPVVPVSP